MFSHNNRILISKKFQVLKAVCRTERICRCHSNNKLGDTALLTVAPSSQQQQQISQRNQIETGALHSFIQIRGTWSISNTRYWNWEATVNTAWEVSQYLPKLQNNNTCQNFKMCCKSNNKMVCHCGKTA